MTQLLAIVTGSLLEDICNCNVVIPTCGSERNILLPHTPLLSALPCLCGYVLIPKKSSTDKASEETYNKRKI